MPISVNAGDPAARAANATQLKYGAQQSQIERALAALAGTRAADEAAINQYGAGGRNAINQTFEQLFGNLETNRQLVGSQLGIQADAVGQGYRDANQIAEAARQQAIANLNKMYGNNVAYGSVQLGEVASPIERLAAQIVGENAQSDATATGNLRNFAAQQDAIMRAGISGAQRDKSNRLAGFESELLRALASAKAAATEEEFNLQGNMLDTITERGTYQNEITQQFMDQLFGQQLQAAQFNLSEQEAVSQAAHRAASLAQSAREMALRERAQSFEESQVGKDDIWKALELDLRRQGLSLEEARDTRNFLMDQSRQQQAEKQYVAEYLNAAIQSAASVGGDVDAARQAAYDQLYELGIGGLNKYKTTSGINSLGGLGVGVSGSATAKVAPRGGGTGTGYGSRALVPTTQNRKPVSPVSGNMARWVGL